MVRRRAVEIWRSFITYGYRAVGAGLAIFIMELLVRLMAEDLARVPFVTSIVLALALPESAPAQPRAIIGGHLVCCGSGWVATQLIGVGDVAAAVAVGLGTIAMLATGTLHPPAGLDGFLFATQTLPVTWIWNPVFLGTLLLAAYSRLWAAGERLLLSRLGVAR